MSLAGAPGSSALCAGSVASPCDPSGPHTLVSCNNAISNVWFHSWPPGLPAGCPACWAPANTSDLPPAVQQRHCGSAKQDRCKGACLQQQVGAVWCGRLDRYLSWPGELPRRESGPTSSLMPFVQVLFHCVPSSERRCEHAQRLPHACHPGPCCYLAGWAVNQPEGIGAEGRFYLVSINAKCWLQEGGSSVVCLCSGGPCR